MKKKASISASMRKLATPCKILGVPWFVGAGAVTEH